MSKKGIHVNARRLRLAGVLAVFLLMIPVVWFGFGESSSAQNAVIQTGSTSFRIGEKLSYAISFAKFQNAGYAETYVVSRGKLSGRDAIEIRSKIKTLNLVSAAFFLVDESRTVYAAPESGLPIYMSTNSHDTVLPKETVTSFLEQPTSSFDLSTLIYRVREAGGVGTFPLSENDTNYSVNFLAMGGEKIKTIAGDFDTTLCAGQSDYFTANGITNFKINLSTDEFHVPVLVRFKTAKGEWRIQLTGITLPEPDTPTPTATPTPSPVKSATPAPKATPTPDPYVENRPLAPELGFQVGESLEYRITSAGKAVAIVTFSARERKKFNNADSLLLTATITGVEQGNTDFHLGDSVTAQVDPETLAPTLLESKLVVPYPGLNSSVAFDKVTGMVRFGAKDSIDAPIGTHSILSLFYAMRSFNLKPSKDRSNPVNDTRVAVFWDKKPCVFTLRPSDPELITVNGAKTSAQLITINTGNPELDKLNFRVWLSTDDRVPLRLAVGAYQADLIVKNTSIFK